MSHLLRQLATRQQNLFLQIIMICELPSYKLQVSNLEVQRSLALQRTSSLLLPMLADLCLLGKVRMTSRSSAGLSATQIWVQWAAVCPRKIRLQPCKGPCTSMPAPALRRQQRLKARKIRVCDHTSLATPFCTYLGISDFCTEGFVSIRLYNFDSGDKKRREEIGAFFDEECLFYGVFAF